MPPYAMNAFDMTRIFREELESKYVRENIHKWIDLIFGVDQKSSEKFNLFFPAAYPEFHKDDKLESYFAEDKTATKAEIIEYQRLMI